MQGDKPRHGAGMSAVQRRCFGQREDAGERGGLQLIGLVRCNSPMKSRLSLLLLLDASKCSSELGRLNLEGSKLLLLTLASFWLSLTATTQKSISDQKNVVQNQTQAFSCMQLCCKVCLDKNEVTKIGLFCFVFSSKCWGSYSRAHLGKAF